MGKNYFCDYCDKRFKDDPNIRKKHDTGMPHQIARKEYYAKFKSAKNILRDETNKKPCSKFQSGQCKFGGLCRFSHYTPGQIAALRQQVKQQEQLQRKNQTKIYSKDLIGEFMQKRERRMAEEKQQTLNELFKYPKDLEQIVDQLPPSLKPINNDELLKMDLTNLRYFG